MANLRLGGEYSYTPFDKGIRSGPDVSVADDVYMHKGETVTVPVLPPTQLLTVFPDILSADPETFGAHVKSRHAQGGLDVHNNAGKVIIESMQNGAVENPISVSLTNLPWRDRKIKASTPIFQLYQRRGPFLGGEELVALVDQGEIGVDGKEGKHWKWHFANGTQIVDEIDGITLSLDRRMTMWIPPSDEVLGVDPVTRRYRKKADRLLQPAPYTGYPIHWVTQTDAPVHLGGAHALIKPEIDEHSRHINSPFIQGVGKTDWKVRAEIVGPTTPKLRARSIIFQFARAA